MKLDVDIGEARCLREVEQPVFVDAVERVLVQRLHPKENCFYFFRNIRHRFDRHSSQRTVWFRKAKPVNGFKKGQSPFMPEDAVKFVECALLVVDVNQNGAKSEHINGRITDTSQIVR